MSEVMGQTPARLVQAEFHRTWIAGRRYYLDAGVAPGDQVFLIREPANAHDLNALAVFSQVGEQIGYLPRGLAAELAPLVDRGIFVLHGRLAAPGEPGYNADRALIAPTLYIWVSVDLDRLDEFEATVDRGYAGAPSGPGILVSDQQEYETFPA